jgi:hypothetical protein
MTKHQASNHKQAPNPKIGMIKMEAACRFDYCSFGALDLFEIWCL